MSTEYVALLIVGVLAVVFPILWLVLLPWVGWLIFRPSSSSKGKGPGRTAEISESSWHTESASGIKTTVTYPSGETTSSVFTYSGPAVEQQDQQASDQSLVEEPKRDWRLSGKPGSVLVDPNWAFLLRAKSEKPCQFYIYSVKNHPELLKIGIAADPVARKESYYKRKLFAWDVPGGRREAELCETLFKHSTFHLANTSAPYWSAGNLHEDLLITEIQQFAEDTYDGSSGLTEIRKMTLEAAKETFRAIWQDVHWQLKVDEAILKWGIQEYVTPSGEGRQDSLLVPHRFWRLRPHNKPWKRDPSTPTAPGFERFNDEMEREDLLRFKEESALCWDPTEV